MLSRMVSLVPALGPFSQNLRPNQTTAGQLTSQWTTIMGWGVCTWGYVRYWSPPAAGSARQATGRRRWACRGRPAAPPHFLCRDRRREDVRGRSARSPGKESQLALIYSLIFTFLSSVSWINLKLFKKKKTGHLQLDVSASPAGGRVGEVNHPRLGGNLEPV